MRLGAARDNGYTGAIRGSKVRYGFEKSNQRIGRDGVRAPSRYRSGGSQRQRHKAAGMVQIVVGRGAEQRRQGGRPRGSAATTVTRSDVAGGRHLSRGYKLINSKVRE